MKYCTNCGAQLDDEIKFCPKCGIRQKPAGSPIEPVTNFTEPVIPPPLETPKVAPVEASKTVKPVYVPIAAPVGQNAIVTLCTLSIIGSVYGLVKGLFFESVYSYYDSFYFVLYLVEMFRWLSPLACAGTLTAAILMLNRKQAGFRLYVISQSVFIFLVLVRNYDRMEGLSLLPALLYCLPPVVFIILYNQLVKKHLK